MLRNRFLLASLAIAVTLIASACATEPPPKPNVVLIFVDDMGYGDIGAYGATAYETPHLDQMAAEGARFTDFYVSQPVCSASRASILTGVYANRLGIHGALGPGNTHGLNPDETTMAEMLKGQGYATAIFGKWHLGHRPDFLPTRHGFDEFYGIPYSNDMWPYHPENPEAWGDLPTFEGEEVVGVNTDQSRFTTDFTDRAVGFVERSVDSGEPFFLYLAHPMPHVPLFVSDERSGKSGAGLYGDVIAEIDWSVGQVLETLKETGIEENTLVLFASDNGPWLSYGNHAGSAGPLREGKGTTWDGGVRVPFIARWPGVIPAGLEVSTPAMTIDVMPSVVEAVGIDATGSAGGQAAGATGTARGAATAAHTGTDSGEMPVDRAIDGRSIWPLITGQTTESPQEAYYFYYRQGELHAMRSGRWKLHFPHTYRTMTDREPGADGMPGKYDYSASVGLELFDLENDIGEARNVAAEHPDVLARLTTMADAKRADLGDRLTGIEGSGLREPGRIER